MVMASTNPKTRERLKRLLLDERFIAIQEAARKNPDNLIGYVDQARQEFKLSGYWTELLQHILLTGFKAEQLGGGAVIESQTDSVTGEKVQKIVVYPEATKADVLRAFSIIRGRQQESGDVRNLRTSNRVTKEVEILRMYENGMTIKQIADESGLMYNEVSDHISKAKKKLSS
jgi:hypothetical protein